VKKITDIEMAIAENVRLCLSVAIVLSLFVSKSKEIYMSEKEDESDTRSSDAIPTPDN
jgi:hypothetical protein